jgi:predicted phosphohydrolase
MNIYQEFKSLVNKYSYRDEIIKKVLKIFEGTGENQILTSDIIPSQLRIKEFVILSDEIERALNILHSKLREIYQENVISSGGLFYFSQYGGSKTQFLHLVKNEINIEFPNCIVILFEDLYHINPMILFDRIFSQIIQVAIQQSKNLKKAEDLLEVLRRVRNPEILRTIEELDLLLHSTILVDSIDILNKIIGLMQFCSQNNIVFLFLFDEVDLWLDVKDEELTFSQEFNKISNLMKLILEISDNRIRSFMVFSCTDRVNLLFQRMQHKFETISPVSSRLNRTYNSSERILEPGNYGTKIENALVNLAAFYHLANNRVKIDTEILEKMVPILDKKYKSYSRRMTNSKIIQLLRNYEHLSQPLERGLRNWKNNATHYGSLIQENLPSILNRLNIRFVRKDISVDPDRTISKDKIDGYFINYTLEDDEIKTHVEIKLTKEFKGEKAYQALQYLQLHKEEHLVMIIFSPSSVEIINREIIKYAENNAYENSLFERLHLILIENPLAFCAINGISSVSSDSNQLSLFLDSYSNWLEFFSDFSNQYRQIKRKIGIDFVKPEKPTTTGPPPPSPQPEYSLSTEEQTCLNLLSNMYHRRKFSSTGRMNKSTIEKFITERSLGITDLEKYLELMDRADIIEKITSAQVTFASNIINTTSLDEVKQGVINFFQRNSQKESSLNVFL